MSDDNPDAQSIKELRESLAAAKKHKEAVQSLQDEIAEVKPVIKPVVKPVATRGMKAKGANTAQASNTPNDGSELDAVRVPVTPKKAVAPNTSATVETVPSEDPNAIPKVARAPKVVSASVPTETPREPAAPAKQQAASAAQTPAAAANQQVKTAADLVNQMAVNIRFWQSSLSDDKEASIVAILANGAEIPIQHLASEGIEGLIIHGELKGEPCMIATHQSNLTLVCTAVDKVAGVNRPEIRFYVDGKKLV